MAWHGFARKDSERWQTSRGSSGNCVVRIHDGDDEVVETAPRAHDHVLQMEKPMAEPGAFAARRIAGQVHDGVPQLGKAFRQILHACGGLAGSSPGFRQEPVRIWPSAGHSVEIVGVTVRCVGFEDLALRGLQNRVEAIPEEVTPPRTVRIAPAMLLPASPCRVARLARSCGNGAHVSRLLLSCNPR